MKIKAKQNPTGSREKGKMASQDFTDKQSALGGRNAKSEILNRFKILMSPVTRVRNPFSVLIFAIIGLWILFRTYFG